MSEQQGCIGCQQGTTRRQLVKRGAAVGVGITLAGTGGLRAAARMPSGARQNEYTIAFIQGVIADNFYITMDCGAREKAEAIGANAYLRKPFDLDALLTAVDELAGSTMGSRQ